MIFIVLHVIFWHHPFTFYARNTLIIGTLSCNTTLSIYMRDKWNQFVIVVFFIEQFFSTVIRCHWLGDNISEVSKIPGVVVVWRPNSEGHLHLWPNVDITCRNPSQHYIYNLYSSWVLYLTVIRHILLYSTTHRWIYQSYPIPDLRTEHAAYVVQTYKHMIQTHLFIDKTQFRTKIINKNTPIFHPSRGSPTYPSTLMACKPSIKKLSGLS